MSQQSKRKMRSACDRCHHCKLRCSGKPCSNCILYNQECVYSLSDPLGRPKGVKNRHTRTGSALQNADSDANVTVEASDEELTNMVMESIHSSHGHWSNLHFEQSIPGMPSAHSMHTSHSELGLPLGSASSSMDPGHGSINSGSLTPPEGLDLMRQSTQLDHVVPRTSFSQPTSAAQTPFRALGMEDECFDWFLNSQTIRTSSTSGVQNAHIPIGQRNEGTAKTQELPLPLYPSPAVSQGEIYSASVSPIPPCTCLQTQANLLAYIRELSSKITSPIPIHILLQTIRRSLESITHLSDCQSCLRQGISEEILLLVSMELRKTLRLFQNSSLSDISGPGLSEPGSTVASGMQTPDSASRGSSRSPTVITIEDYCLDGDDVVLVGHILAVRGLRRLMGRVSTLLDRTPHAKRLGQVRGFDLANGLESELDPVKEVLKALSPMANHLE